MKKLLLSLFLVKSIIYADVDCPKLDQENSNGKLSEQILKELDSLDWAKRIYVDILQKYNGTADIKKFVSEDSLAHVSATPIWGTLIGLNYVKNTAAYEDVINTIDPDNSDWCKQSSYKHLLQKKN